MCLLFDHSESEVLLTNNHIQKRIENINVGKPDDNTNVLQT